MINLFKNRCYNDGKKHKYKPRYSTELEMDIKKLVVPAYDNMADVIESFKTKKYIHDICEWCGNIKK